MPLPRVSPHFGTGRHTERWRPWLLAGLAYTVLILVQAWPVVRAIRTALPHDLGDPLLNTWILWRNAWVVPFSEAWWNAPSFHPIPGVFGLSELLLGLWPLTSPIQWAGGSPELAYNVTFLLSYPLAAMAAHLLVYRLTGRHDVALLAGLAFGFGTLRTAHLAQLQLLWSWWMPLMLLGLHSYASGARAGLLLFAAAWLMQGLGSGYYLLSASLLAAGWVAWFMTAGGQRARLLPLLCTWLLAAVPLVPVWLGYRSSLGTLGLQRGVGEVETFSADMASLIGASPDLTVWGRVLPTIGPERDLFLGLTLTTLAIVVAVASWRNRAAAPPLSNWRKLALAMVGIFACVGASALIVGPWALKPLGISVARPHKPWSMALVALAAAGLGSPRLLETVRQRSVTGFYAVMAVVFWILSLGPTPTLLGTRVAYKAPFAWLMGLPGFENLRVPARFAILAALCLIVAVARRLAPMAGRLGRLRPALLVAACAGLVIDGWGGPIGAFGTPVPPARPVDSRQIDAVVELPLGTPERDAAAQYRMKYHGVPVVNGYSGFAPPHFDVIRSALADGDPRGVLALRTLGRLWVIVDRRAAEAALLEQWVLQASGTSAGVAGTEATYVLPRLECPPAATNERRVSIARLTASEGSANLSNLLDANRRSVWMSGRTQQGGEQLLADLGAVEPISSVVLEQGAYAPWYARALSVEWSTDGMAWNPGWAGSPVVEVVCGALRDPLRVPTRLPVGATTRFIRVTQTGRSAEAGWALAGFEVTAPSGAAKVP